MIKRIFGLFAVVDTARANRGAAASDPAAASALLLRNDLLEMPNVPSLEYFPSNKLSA
jgi:hypothetical protein